jgi:hypothetical protein
MFPAKKRKMPPPDFDGGFSGGAEGCKSRYFFGVSTVYITVWKTLWKM